MEIDVPAYSFYDRDIFLPMSSLLLSPWQSDIHCVYFCVITTGIM